MSSSDATNEAIFDKLVAAIVDDRSHGASELARQALRSLAEFSEHTTESDSDRLAQDLLHLAARLKDARPSMAVVHNLIDQWLTEMANEKFDSIASVIAAAQRNSKMLTERSKEAALKAAANAAKLVSPGQSIMTHSYSSSISQLFQQLATRKISAIITESQPGCEGRQLARELSELSIPTDYITDAQIGLFVTKADFIFVGADTLLADGSVVNKSGTYPLALAAKDKGTPFFVCCESFKQSQLGTDQVTLETMNSDEIALDNLPNVDKHNIYFEITPAYLVSGWINEQGFNNYD